MSDDTRRSRNVLVVANPVAGVRDAALVGVVARHCSRYAGDLAVTRTAGPGDAEDVAAKAASDGVDVVVVRILGGRRAWEDGLDALLAGP
nr:hypothetical protein [Micromonospora sp. DSM 115978]